MSGSLGASSAASAGFMPESASVQSSHKRRECNNKKKQQKKKCSAPENPPFFIPHMFSGPLLIPPSASRRFFLGEAFRVAAGFVPLYCSRSKLPLCCCPLGSLYLPPSFPPSPPHPPLLSLSPSLSFSER